MNEYTPWIEKGMTELEYFKYRYLEMSKENDRLEQKNNAMLTEINFLISGIEHFTNEEDRPQVEHLISHAVNKLKECEGME